MSSFTNDSPLLSTSPSHPFPLTHPPPGTALPAEHFPQNEHLPLLFTPLKIRSLELKNRIVVSPMCQYSASSTGAEAGCVNTWHTSHYLQLATRGASLVFFEATAVSPEGRLSPQDLGLWNDTQRDKLKELVGTMQAAGAKVGVQIGHAGRKSSTLPPWMATSPDASKVATNADYAGWEDEVVAPSAIPYHEATYPHPKEMTSEEIEGVKQAFVDAARRADEAGADVLELHAAHGYLVHNFLSPLSNQRKDKYGGSLEDRLRHPLELISLVRAAWPDHKPLFMRISGTEWHPAGEKHEKTGEWISWGIEQSKFLVREAVKFGVDLIDVSSGGNASDQAIKTGPLYQVPLASAIRESLHADFANSPSSSPNKPLRPALVSAVGLITTAQQAESVLQLEEADVITMGRQFLRDPSFVFNAAMELGVVVQVPVQYARAFTRMLKHHSPRDDHQCHCRFEGYKEEKVGEKKTANDHGNGRIQGGVTVFEPEKARKKMGHLMERTGDLISRSSTTHDSLLVPLLSYSTLTLPSRTETTVARLGRYFQAGPGDLVATQAASEEDEEDEL
ncbi:hypothetical protein JCM8547_002141 [Rhodosporidiobolus lusitaniae]